MYTFITIFALTIIICSCFYKKNMWENRYLVLLIGASLSLVSMISVNYVARSKADIKIVVNSEKKLSSFYMINTDLKYAKDSNNVLKRLVKNNYSFYNNHDASEFIKSKKYPHSQTKISFILYENGGTRYVGVFVDKRNGDQIDFYHLNNIYFQPSKDSNAYVQEEIAEYNVQSKWVVKGTIPSAKSATIIYVPKWEYAMIPNSLLRKLPVEWKRS